MTPLGSGACQGALLWATVVTAGLGHLDSLGCFQTQPHLSLPPPWRLAWRLPPQPLILQPGKKSLLTQNSSRRPGSRDREGVPCPSSREDACCRKALCIRLHDNCI